MLKLYLFSHKVNSKTFIINSSSTHYNKVASSCPHWKHTYSLISFCKIKLTGTHTSRSPFSSKAPRTQYFTLFKLHSDADRQTCLKLPNPLTTSLRRGQNQHYCQEPRSTTRTSSCTGTQRGLWICQSPTQERKFSWGEPWASFKLILFCSKRQKMSLLNHTHLKTYFCTFIIHTMQFQKCWNLLPLQNSLSCSFFRYR